ncbi:hypothetical protein K501DRAFT_188987, partial [Backusella circina FSU 941]
RQKTQALVDCKASILSKSEVLEYKRNLYEETISEKQRLLKEKRALLDMLQNVQNDLEQLVDIEKTLAKENEQLEKQVLHLKTEQYDPLHDHVNEIRVQNGMSKLAHIQQESDAQLARALEERRIKWQQVETPESSQKKKSGRPRRR